MIDPNKVKSKINYFLINEFEMDPNSLNPKAKLIEDLGLDSLDFVDVVVEVEEKFGVKLDGNDFINVSTLDDFYNLIIEKLK
tara:strand:+ start:1729 stop:1974 length:246 start_codon:yes stop_codon:yes gene_type:complete